ncbi:MAG: hypothetical protein V3W20_05955 [Candidatus Neomarinimicrobiota bacterium]
MSFNHFKALFIRPKDAQKLHDEIPKHYESLRATIPQKMYHKIVREVQFDGGFNWMLAGFFCRERNVRNILKKHHKKLINERNINGAKALDDFVIDAGVSSLSKSLNK